MSTLGLVLVLFGLIIVVTRLPLVVAPERSRKFFLLIIGTPQRMRGLGFLILLLGVLLASIAADETGIVANVVWLVGLYMVLVAGFYLIPFSDHAMRLAARVWQRFTPTAMRALGSLAVVFGVLLMAWGASL